MIIDPGTHGNSNWTYRVNPLFVSLDETLMYSGIGIGSYAITGAPEKVYLWPNLAFSYLGYDITRSGFNLVDGTVKESKDMRNSISQSTMTCVYTTYKWAIARILNSDGGDSTTFVIFRNVNGSIERENYNDPGGIAWKSIHKNKIYKDYYWGMDSDNQLKLRNYGQTYSTEYNEIIFDCEDLVWDDPGYQAMIEYLSNDDAYGHQPSTKDKDPYENIIPPSTPGGGGGNGRIYDVVDEPDLPSLSAIDTGFLTLYSPDNQSLNTLASELWTTNFWDNIIKNYQDPFDAILSLSIIPFTVAGTSKLVNIGNYQTTISMPKVNSQYISIDLGSIAINEEVGSYLDYSPYTRLTLFLPYIGFVPLNVDEYMGKELTVKYHVDLLTGACVAYLFVNGVVHSQYTGNVATQIPISGRDMSSLYQSMINVGLSAIGTVATGGLTSALSAGALAASASTVMSSKDKVQVGGSIQGSSGFLGIQKPYIVIESPNLCVPSRQNYFSGYPAYMTASLGSLSGYTEVDSCHLEGIPCTASELEEIERLLKGGVIL